MFQYCSIPRFFFSIRKTIKPLLIISIFLSLSCNSQKSEENAIQDKNSPKPNIIFILTDDFGYGDLGVLFQNERKEMGDRSEPWLLTPNLDKMASEGARLPQHYSAAPVCAPSRASLLLGVSQGQSNVRDNQFDKALEDNYTLGTVMHEAGYSTVAIGKWGLQGKAEAPNWPAHPLKRGFDSYYGYIRHVDGHEHYPKEGVYRGAKEVYEDYKEVTNDLDKCYTGDLFTARAKKYIIDHQKNEKDRPFFMYLAYDTPHAVLELPTQEYPKGSGLNGGLQWLGTPGEMINTASGEVDSYMDQAYKDQTYDDDSDSSTDEVPWPDTYKRFATVNKRIDNQVGDIIQLLKDLNIDKNTLVIFTSDNGPSRESYLPKEYENYTPEFFNNYAHFDGIKRDCYEGGVRMATLAMWPGTIPAGSVVKSPSISYDWMPTFAEAAGIAAPIKSDGVSILSSLTGKKNEKDSKIYVEYFHSGSTPEYPEFGDNHQDTKRKQMQMIRMKDMVGVRYNIQSESDDFKIYNVLKDPGQRNNIASENADLQKKMKEKVLQMRHTDTSAPRTYDNAIVPDVKKDNLKIGLLVKSYNNVLPWISSIDDNPLNKEDVKTINGKNFKGNLVVFEGYIDVPENGLYTFSIDSDNKTFMRVHDITAIDGDFGNKQRNYPVNLAKGFHPIKLYIQGERAIDLKNLKLKWNTKSSSVEVSPQAFFHI